MIVYLIRHGESEGNVGPFVQGPEESLTADGIKQAQLLGKRFQSISADVILSSPEERAKKTAEIIGKYTNIPIELSDLLVEFIKPSVIIKKLKKDPKVKEIKKLLKDNFHVSGWKHSDEENFEDFKKRAVALLNYLLTRKEQNIVIATHGIFMRMLIAVVIIGDELTSYEYWKFFVALYLDNTGITVLKSNDKELYDDAPKWELVTWNDHAHLGEVE
ncbi:MAG: Phosphoglycerate mutase family protein [Parcubacteria group bacterium GW2011_GWA1_36_12]|uniref:Phosphoglycerate mutase family protein n=1 Tax=Candidatus Daviesbacteria bacterium GW2011_GWB1_41_5 TaxID=1618429 RepID=A0A0G0WIC9_9BACT|nr:MAG: Phosphoglycerate mutase family protein [Parcubacteria group bacterium GW2011_GWA1_36_12]KKS11802.1 MAG: Phosphoglycerate mutase family protein [Candidatus Daviesbacteria bacterium GW2011_GWB1_41_5]